MRGKGKEKKEIIGLSIINIINHYYVILCEIMLLPNHIIDYGKI